MAKNYVVYKETSPTTHWENWHWYCKDNPTVEGIAETKKDAIATAESACGRKGIGNENMPHSQIADGMHSAFGRNNCSCSGPPMLRSSSADFKHLLP